MNLLQMSSINHCQRQCIGAYRKARAHVKHSLLSVLLIIHSHILRRNQGTVLSKQMAHCDVPLELWRNIFTLACTDGGFTGISLALVSKHFHAASLPVRLHSLALTSLRQVEGFLSFIEARQDIFASRGGPRVHHLLLKDADSPSPPPFHDNKTPEETQRWMDAWEGMRREKLVWDARFVSAVERLLQVAAPHLHSLALLQYSIDLPPLTCRLPLLEELILLGTVAPFNHQTTTNADASSPFPSLRRLHMISFSCDLTLEKLPMLAPILSHLRISNTDYSGLPAALRAAIGMSAPASRYLRTRTPPSFDPNIHPSYPTLRQIIIQTTPPRPGGRCGNPHINFGNLVHDLESMERVCREQPDGVQLVTFSGGRHFARYWEKRAQKDWLERMAGGRGCWVLQQVEGEEVSVEHYDDSDDDLS